MEIKLNLLTLVILFGAIQGLNLCLFLLFKKSGQPLVIMSVIPFGFVGAIIDHGVNGVSLSLLSFFGMLAVTGIVINDSLVMLTRFKPIILTTLTTVCGLISLLSETSEQAQYLIPAVIRDVLIIMLVNVG